MCSPPHLARPPPCSMGPTLFCSTPCISLHVFHYSMCPTPCVSHHSMCVSLHVCLTPYVSNSYIPLRVYSTPYPTPYVSHSVYISLRTSCSVRNTQRPVGVCNMYPTLCVSQSGISYPYLYLYTVAREERTGNVIRNTRLFGTNKITSIFLKLKIIFSQTRIIKIQIWYGINRIFL